MVIIKHRNTSFYATYSATITCQLNSLKSHPVFEYLHTHLLLGSCLHVRVPFIKPRVFASKLLYYLARNYPSSLTERYKIELSEDETGFELLEKVGRKRGMMISGGEINTERAAITVLDEFRSGKLGRISLELPPEKEQ